MRLNDTLVTSFKFNNRKYDIDLAFDNVLDVFDVMADETLRDYEKIETNLALLIGDQEYEDSTKLWNYIYTNYIEQENKRPIQYDRKGNPMPPKPSENKPVYDLEQDAEHIYASFQQAYEMNLFEQQGKLHWFEFRALLNGLPSNTMLQRVIQIRSWKPSKGDSAETKKNMKELQDIYKLHDESEVE